MDPLQNTPVNPRALPTTDNKPVKDPVSSQGSKIPDLGEKGKQFIKAVVQTGSSTFEKVKNYFGGTSKLSASKYKEDVLKQLPESDLKEQIKGLNSINDIRAALYATNEGNSIDASASFYGKTATAKSDLGKLQDAAIRAETSAKEKISELKSSFGPTARIKNEILSNIKKELKTSSAPELLTLRTSVENSKSIEDARLAVQQYRIMTQSESRFEGNRPLNNQQYKLSVLSQLDNARGSAELNDLETRDYDRLRKLLELADSPADIQDTIAEYNLDNFDPDEVHDNAVTASRYSSSIDKLESAAKNAAERIKSLFKT